ncbi:MAG: formylglycine-generating enzyme family protein, partial [Planctomycetota bacterium]
RRIDKIVRYKNPEATPEAKERRAFEALAKSEDDPFEVMEKLREFAESKPDSPYAEKAKERIEELRRQGLPAGVRRSNEKGIFINDKDGAELVEAPAASFPFGKGAGIRVSCSAFLIYRTEVTNGRFAAFLAAGGNPGKRVKPTGWVRKGRAWVPKAGTESLPVRGIPWTAAQAYAAWAGGQLPTEAQWEYAARGKSGNVYPWGSDTPDPTLARYDSKEPLTCGSLVRGSSPVGAQDMAGNVWEWCRDNFEKDPSFEVGAKDPVFTGFSFGRVVKGGGYNSGADSLRAVNRTGLAPNSAHPWLGFRVVVPAK